MKTPTVAAVLLLWLVSTPAAISQTYRIDWYSIDAGGGTSSGGAYAMASTIGQPDATPITLTGGTYSLQGGFWPGIVTATAGGDSPLLALQIVGGNVILSWLPATTGFQLEQADTLASPSAWQSCPEGNPVSLPIEGSTRFYRLRKP